MPEISVVVPVYNSERYLAECLESIINQTFTGIEVICVNDGSTDGSRSILEEYAAKDTRVKLINTLNSGQGRARNTALDAAEGKYISFVDSDDFLAADAYERCISILDGQNCDILFFGVKVFGGFKPEFHDEKNEYNMPKYEGGLEITDEIRLNSNVSLWSKIFRRDIIEKYAIRFSDAKHAEDVAFIWKYLLMSGTAYCLKDVLYHYRQHADSIMGGVYRQVSPLSVEHLHVWKEIYDFMCRHNILEEDKDTLKKLFKLYFSYAYMLTPAEMTEEVLSLGRKYAGLIGYNVDRYAKGLPKYG